MGNSSSSQNPQGLMGMFGKYKKEHYGNIDFEKIKNYDWKGIFKGAIRIEKANQNEFEAFSKKEIKQKEVVVTKSFVDLYKSLKLEDSVRPDIDPVEEFNKKFYSKDDIQNMKIISGAFYKCRSKGAVSSVDLDQNNIFYKRSLATFTLMALHSYFVMTILYDSKLISHERYPKLYRSLPMII